jgi:hypothetical protein
MTEDAYELTRSVTLVTIGLAVVWGAAAAWRPTSTYHLAPMLVVGVGPIMLWNSRRAALRAGGFGTLVAGVTTAILALLDLLRGPSLLPAGGALAESVVFATATALLLAAAAAVPVRRSAH